MSQIQESDLNYQLDDIIGNGATARVFKGIYIPQNQQVAIKKFLEPLKTEDLKISFKREVEVMATCVHPTILKIFGYSIPKNGIDPPLMVTEYMQNGCLQNVLQNLSATQRHIIFFGVLAGMEFLHAQNVIHRDLKSANILLDENFQPRIADFGLSKFSQSNFQSIVGGTPFFMAPELFLGDEYDEKVDVYAFGILAYQVLCGKLPFPENINFARLSQLITTGKFNPFPDHIPTYFKQLLTTCLQMEPTRRPSFLQVINSVFFNQQFLPGTDILVLRNYYRFIYQNQIESPKIFLYSTQLFQQNEPQFIQYLLKAANQGHKPAITECVNVFLLGKGSQNPDLHKYIHYFIESNLITIDDSFSIPLSLIQLNYLDLFIASAAFYKNGQLLYQIALFLKSQDLRKALRIFKIATKLGSMESAFECGLALYKGNGVPCDVLKSAPFFAVAAQLGHAEAQYYCGSLLLNNNCGIKTDEKKAFYFLSLAAKTGHVDSLYLLALLYFNLQQYEMAIQPLQMAAQKGHSQAQFQFGVMLEKGIGISQPNIEEAIKYYRMASTNEHDEATLNLGTLLLKTNDIEGAKTCFQKLALKRHPQGAFNYATLLELNPNTKDEANQFYQLAVELGCVDARYNFSLYLVSQQKIDEALNQIQVFLQSVNENNPYFDRACFVCGQLLMKKKQVNEGMNYIKKAAEKGYERAIQFLQSQQ